MVRVQISSFVRIPNKVVDIFDLGTVSEFSTVNFMIYISVVFVGGFVCD